MTREQILARIAYIERELVELEYSDAYGTARRMTELENEHRKLKRDLEGL